VNRLALLPLAILLVLTACTTRYIGNSMIEDNEENREILHVIEAYRRAVEDRDIQKILDLTSASYFEDPGTPGDPSDDYDKAGLREKLEETFAQIEDLTLRIDPRKVEFSEDRSRVFVEYRYDLRFRMILPSASEWRETQDLKRVELKREDGTWRFVAGI